MLFTQIVKTCNCYDYQACETDDYDASEAAQLVHGVRNTALEAAGKPDGKLYDDLLWSIY